MNTKQRILSVLMSVLMLVGLVAPVVAYTTPYETAQTVEWEPAIIMDGNSTTATFYGGTLEYATSNSGVADTTAAPGALHLVNSASTNSNYSATNTVNNSAWTTTPEKYVHNDEGATLDVYMKIDNLPKITDSTYLQDDGVNFSTNALPSGILFGGLVFQIIGRQANWDDVSGHYTNTLQGAMVYYDNESLGTNAAFILGVGDRNGTVTGRPYTFFFNIPEGEYARYTLVMDPQTLTTKFYVNGEAQVYNTGDSNEIPTVTLMFYTKQTYGNVFNICMNGPAHASTSANAADYYCDIWLDQAAIYADACTPKGTEAGAFVEEVPLNFTDLENWINVTKDLNESFYTEDTWADLMAAVEAVDLELEGLKQSQVKAWANAIKAAFGALEFEGTDKFYISNVASSARNGTAWTCGSVLVTESGYKASDYSVSGMTIDTWSRIYCEPVGGDVFRVKKVVLGSPYTNLSAGTPVGADEVVPVGGFAIFFHQNMEGNSSTPWNPLAGGSQYAAQEFGDRNGQAFVDMGIVEGSLVKLVNVGFNADGDSTLQTSGTWYHRYTEGVIPTPIYRVSGQENTEAVEGGPQYLARDQFENFVSESYLVTTDALPNLTVNVSGAGSVEATAGDSQATVTADAAGEFVLATGDDVTLTAVGEGFGYWKNAKNGAILSTDRTLSFPFAVSAMEITAVFLTADGEEVTTYDVVFKDNLTGKIVSTLQVAAGTTVATESIPAMSDLFAYTFRGWYADGNLTKGIADYAIEANTTFYGLYEKDSTASYKLTLKNGDTVRELTRRYASIVTIGTNNRGFSYWTLDGAALSSANITQFSMPKADCTIEAVYDSVTEFVPTATMLSCFVDDNGTMMATMLRDVPAGYELVESGILMTRKGTVSDLIATTASVVVTRGISTASADSDVYGFVKTDLAGKTGTWYVRAYVTYKDAAGNLGYAHSVVYAMNVDENCSPVTATPYRENVEFAVGAGINPYAVDTEIFVAEEFDTAGTGYKAFFPTITQADDGTLIVVYYYGTSHALYNQTEGKLKGVLMMQKSIDNGETWSTPEVIVDLTDEDVANGDYNRESRDPNLQKLSDGTIVLTFPVRAPIGMAGLNGSSKNDYWYERAYYMTSTDNGATWNEMQLIECDYFSDEPFLYDDPTRTTGCWVKNGSMAELANGDLLIPLYGAVDCSTRAILESVVVKAKNNGDGTLTFVKDWALTPDGELSDAAVVSQVRGDELGLWGYGDTIYGGLRTSVATAVANDKGEKGAPIFVSYDAGATWQLHAVEVTENACLNQPHFSYVSEDYAMFNYSVPLASGSSVIRYVRATYGRLINLKTGEWDENPVICLHDVETSSTAKNHTDAGNAATVLMDDGRMLTVFYDNEKNNGAIVASYIGGKYTIMEDYLAPSGGSLGGTPVAGENFDALTAGTLLESATSLTTYPGEATVDVGAELEAAVSTTSTSLSSSSVYATVGLEEEEGNLLLALRSKVATRRKNISASVTTKDNMPANGYLQFDYRFLKTTADSAANTNRINVTLFDDGAADTYLYITPGAINLVTPDGDTSVTFTASADTNYTFKAMYLGGTLFFKAWIAGEAEPADWFGKSVVALGGDLPCTITYENKFNSGTAKGDVGVLLDNITMNEVELKLAGINPGKLSLAVGKKASLYAKFDADIELSGEQVLPAYSDNPSVATINAYGVVTAVGKGVANIRVTFDGTELLIPVVVR